jgi:two-component system, sensor histidine kinase and response regulator
MSSIDPHSATILIVDDDQVILETVEDILRLAGYHTLIASNGVEGLERLYASAPDLILSDISMPNMDGYQFYEAVRANPTWTLIPFIFLSARGQRTDIRRGNRLGADAYLVKPFEPEDLLGAVESRIARQRDIEAVVNRDLEHTRKELVHVLGHELRTPLSYIYGYVELLREGHEELEKADVDRMLTSISDGAQRLGRLVEDVVMLASLDSGFIAATIEKYSDPVDVAGWLNKVAAAFADKAAAVNAEVEVDSAAGLTVSGFEGHLVDALGRLVDNAIKFAKHGEGRVAIRAARDGDKVMVMVEDNGIGMGPDALKHVFRRFEQIDRETMEQQGAGIGLAIAKGLIEAHGGDIEVSSQLGKGSVFTISMARE